MFSGHAHHQLLQRALSVVFMDQQHLFDGVRVEAHLIELIQKVEEFLSLDGKDATVKPAVLDGL